MAGNRNYPLFVFLLISLLFWISIVCLISLPNKISEKGLNEVKELINELKKNYAEKEELFKKIEKFYQKKIADLESQINKLEFDQKPMETNNKADFDELQLSLIGCGIENGKFEKAENICQEKLVAFGKLLKTKNAALEEATKKIQNLQKEVDGLKMMKSNEKPMETELCKNADLNEARLSLLECKMENQNFKASEAICKEKVVASEKMLEAKEAELEKEAKKIILFQTFLNKCEVDYKASSQTVIEMKKSENLYEKSKDKLKEQLKVTTEAFSNALFTTVAEFPKIRNLIKEEGGEDIFVHFPQWYKNFNNLYGFIWDLFYDIKEKNEKIMDI